MGQPVDTDNDFLLGFNSFGGGMLGFQFPPMVNSKQKAYRTAAWLVTMAEVLPDEAGQEDYSFEDVLEAVQST